MRRRWCAAGLVEAEKTFRRVRGHVQLPPSSPPSLVTRRWVARRTSTLAVQSTMRGSIAAAVDSAISSSYQSRGAGSAPSTEGDA